MIYLIYPSRGRPDKFRSTWSKWEIRCTMPHKWLISLDDDDTSSYANVLPPNATVFVKHNTCLVEAVNAIELIPQEDDIIILVSDDFDNPFNGWDAQIAAVDKQGKAAWVMRTNDMSDNGRVHQKWIITLPIVSGGWYLQHKIYHHEYRHMFCDTEMTHKAQILDAIIDATHLHFPHNHYMSALNEKDDVSKRADTTFMEGMKIYGRRARMHFGIEPVTEFCYDDHAEHIAFMARFNEPIPFIV